MFGIDLTGRNGLVMGVTNERSLAWAIAGPLAEAGARLAFSYQGERLRPRLEALTAGMPGVILAPCDVTRPNEVDALFETLASEMPQLDYVVHALAYAPPRTFQHPFVDTSLEDWQTALQVSAYSLVAVTRHASRLMTNGGSIVTLSYIASERVIPHYNVMGVAKAALEASMRHLAFELGPRGIRLNAVSAGPVRTVAGHSIPAFRAMHAESGAHSMLRRNIDAREVGAVGFTLLCDELSSGITGESVRVDAGYHAMGMFLPDS